MLNIMDFENLKIYRNKISYPIGTKAKNKETALLLSGKDYESNKKIMFDKMVRNRALYNSYFIENKYNGIIFGKNIKKNLTKDNVKRFNVIRGEEDNKFIRKYAYNYEQLKGLNAYIDLSVYLTDLFNIAEEKRITAKRVASYFTEQIIKPMKQNLIDNGYINIIHVIDLQNVDLMDTDNYDKIHADNVFAIIMYLMRYEFDKFISEFGDTTILLRNSNFSILIKPSECDKDSFKVLMANLKRVKVKKQEEELGIATKLSDEEVNTNIPQDHNKFTRNNTIDISNNSVEEASTEKDDYIDTISKVVKADIIGSITSMDTNQRRSYAFTGAKPAEVSNVLGEDKLEDAIENKVDELVNNGTIKKGDKGEEIMEKVHTSLENDEDFMTELQIATSNRLANIMSPQNLARNKELARKQAEINYKGKTIKQILSENANKELKPKKLNRKDIINKNMTELALPNLDRMYNKEIYDRDIINIINSFQDMTAPLYILDIKKEDSSDDFNKKSTWTVKFEAADRSRHTLTFDLPNIVNDSFMYLGGNKKNMYKQLFLLPISKTAPHEVQICTNYNKAFITRLGDKMSPKTERFRKVVGKYEQIKYVLGDSTKENMKYVTTLEFDEMAKHYVDIHYKKQYTFIFNINKAMEYFAECGFNIPKEGSNIIPLGSRTVNGKLTPIYFDTKKDVVQGTKDSIVDYMIQSIGSVDDNDNMVKDFYSATIGKKFMYSSVKIMAKAIPLILVLLYAEGMTRVLDKAEINYSFSDTRPQLKDSDKTDKGIIEFSDGYLIYDKYPYANSLLLNGLSAIPTKNYSYADMDGKEVYLDIFYNLFGSKSLANALDNFYDLLIDPITKEVLEDMQLPTDYVGVFVYANRLLEDNEYTNQISMNGIRIRGNEIISAIAYKTIAKAYEGYRATAGNKSPKKMTVPKDQVIKDILTMNTVEDYSTLNPITESEKTRAISFKGHSGMNLERAYTVENRSYDKSMLGIVSLSSPPTGGVGLVRQLPLDSNILSTRGYVKVANSEDDLKNTNMFSPAEMLITNCTTKDDAPTDVWGSIAVTLY